MQVLWLFVFFVLVGSYMAFSRPMPFEVDDQEMKAHQRFVAAMEKSQQ